MDCCRMAGLGILPDPDTTAPLDKQMARKVPARSTKSRLRPAELPAIPNAVPMKLVVFFMVGPSATGLAVESLPGLSDDVFDVDAKGMAAIHGTWTTHLDIHVPELSWITLPEIPFPFPLSYHLRTFHTKVRTPHYVCTGLEAFALVVSDHKTYATICENFEAANRFSRAKGSIEALWSYSQNLDKDHPFAHYIYEGVDTWRKGDRD